jgi:hypothetical protein
MPAYQSTTELGLARKYRLKAVGCEAQAEHATDRSTEQEWQQLASQWHSMAEQAARLSDETSLDDGLSSEDFTFKSERH